jgi:hypothetical protein
MPTDSFTDLSTRRLAIGGVALDLTLPNRLTPLADMENALTAAWGAYTVATTTTPPGERPQLWLNRWRLLLVELYATRQAEFGGRRSPNLKSTLVPLELPLPERRQERLHLDGRYGELRHVSSGMIWYDLHIRTATAARPTMPAPLPLQQDPEPPLPQPHPTLHERLVEKIKIVGVSVVREAHAKDREALLGLAASPRHIRRALQKAADSE